MATEMMAYNNVCMRGRGVTDLFVIVTAVYRVFQKIITEWHKAENWINVSSQLPQETILKVFEELSDGLKVRLKVGSGNKMIDPF